MDRLSRFVGRRRRLVLATWGIVLLASLPFAAQQTKHLTAGGFEVPGSQSLQVAQDLPNFWATHPQQMLLVFDNPHHNKQQLWTAIDNAVVRIQGVKNVSIPRLGLALAGGSYNKDVALLPLTVQGNADQAVDAAVTLRKKLHVQSQGNAAIPVQVVGQQALWAALQDVSKKDLEKAEVGGFPIVLIVLLLIFGSLAAAALPVSLGVGSVIVTGAAIFFLSLGLEMSVFVTNIASMLGIGVAVDYSLFILARYREELRGGATPEEARVTAMRTSGLAVAISGATVIISVAGLFVIDSTMLRSMAIGAIVVVAIAILAAITLLPALMRTLDTRIGGRGKIITRLGARLRAFRPAREKPAGAPGFWDRWTGGVMRRPVVCAVGAAALMLLIAIPALHLTWGTAALKQLPASDGTRQAFEAAQKQLGPGALGPINVIATFDGKVNESALARFSSRAATLSDVDKVGKPRLSFDGHQALVVVTPKTGPEDPATVTLVNELRAPNGPGASLRGVATLAVGGVPAENKDFTTLVSGSMWKIFVFVLLFSYLVLLVMLRSVILPLKAVLMNVLTVAAAYGVLVIVFQYGWTDTILNYHHLGHVNAPTPPLLLAIVFGLSMDYEVFLLSRIRERYAATGNNRTAVAQGLAASAQTISSAALIMVLVFAVFALTGLPQVKEIGVGLSAAILLDATLVRLVLVPATMELMGSWNWWLPAWLGRILPEIDVEGGAPSERVVPESPAVPS
ncbi:MAG TPA: MMPL family transporter [Gaiellaceae bacterium]|nr:MMPL family transporter [Gaiellaceae bacterium]